MPALQKEFGELFVSVSHLWRHQLDNVLRSDARLAPYNLSLAKWRVLLRLARNPEGLSQRALARQIGVEGPTIVGLIDRLEADGLVERGLNPNDRRARIIRLQPAGAALSPIIEEHAEKLRARIVSNIPQADLDIFQRTLGAMQSALQQLSADIPE